MTDDRIIETALMLERAALAAGLFITGDQRISESDAAALMGYACEYLRQLRAEGKGPVSYRAGINGARVSYRLNDLADWIEARREP